MSLGCRILLNVKSNLALLCHLNESIRTAYFESDSRKLPFDTSFGRIAWSICIVWARWGKIDSWAVRISAFRQPTPIVGVWHSGVFGSLRNREIEFNRDGNNDSTWSSSNESTRCSMQYNPRSNLKRDQRIFSCLKHFIGIVYAAYRSLSWRCGIKSWVGCCRIFVISSRILGTYSVRSSMIRLCSANWPIV